jgi:arabinogalactan endo-1,4-beta-galactosidase
LPAPGYFNAVNAFLNNSNASVDIALLAGTDTKTYNVTFDKPVKETVKVSFPPASGDPNYQAVTNSKDEAVGGKYNPVTKKLDVKIGASDKYTVKENKKDFTDITNKSKEMQEAIKVLASKGIINGTSTTTFAPDSPITRAEIAALITRTLAKYDANADGGFSDVKRSDWYFGAAGSASRYGIMNGTSPTTFAPRVNIPKDQIVAVAARVLRNEMRYKDPSNVNGVLDIYSDASSIATWGRTDRLRKNAPAKPPR